MASLPGLAAAETGAASAAVVLGCLETMQLIREFEERSHEAVLEGLVHGSLHQSTGQEAVAVGVCSNLRPSDMIQSNHRNHGHAIAKGADPIAMMKELFGRVGGTSGGKGGSMHIADFSVGMMGANGILADGVPLAVGAAQAAVIKGEDRVVCAFVGDGTTNRGPFYEGLNWAKVFNLPLLIVCEDNGYASTTLTRSVTAGGGAAVRAEAFDIPAVTVDGNDLVAVHKAARELTESVRGGGGPRLLHALTYRIRGHVSRDMLAYRAAGETDEHWRREPIARCIQWLRGLGVSDEEIEEVRGRARTLISRAIDEARAAPFPDPGLAYADVQDIGGGRG